MTVPVTVGCGLDVGGSGELVWDLDTTGDQCHPGSLACTDGLVYQHQVEFVELSATTSIVDPAGSTTYRIGPNDGVWTTVTEAGTGWNVNNGNVSHNCTDAALWVELQGGIMFDGTAGRIGSGTKMGLGFQELGPGTGFAPVHIIAGSWVPLAGDKQLNVGGFTFGSEAIQTNAGPVVASRDLEPFLTVRPDGGSNAPDAGTLTLSLNLRVAMLGEALGGWA